MAEYAARGALACLDVLQVGLLSTDPYIIRIRVYTLVYTLYMANWAVVYAFSDSTRKAYMAAIWAQNRGFRVPFEGTNTSLRSGFTQVDASHNSPVGCNCNCQCMLCIKPRL